MKEEEEEEEGAESPFFWFARSRTWTAKKKDGAKEREGEREKEIGGRAEVLVV